MQVLIIDPQTRSIQTQDFDGQITDIYTFFNSILVDTSNVLKNHIIYTNAEHKDTTPFFIGNQLFLGKALVLGLNELSETDVSIEAKELESLLNYEISPLYEKSIEALVRNDLNLYKIFDIQTPQEETLQLNYEWVVYTFNMADQKTQEYFLEQLANNANNAEQLAAYMQKMAALAV